MDPVNPFTEGIAAPPVSAPRNVRQNAQRILDKAARRLLDADRSDELSNLPTLAEECSAVLSNHRTKEA